MRILLAVLLLAATGTARAQGTSEAILGYTNVLATLVQGTAGWTFQVTNTITVTELGCVADFFDHNMTTNLVEVGLWSPDGALLASNSISPASTSLNQSLYAPVTPVVLTSGDTYHIGVYLPNAPNGEFQLDAVGAPIGCPFSNSPAITSIQTAQGFSGFASPPQETGTLGDAYLGPNFQFFNGMPEPSSGALLALGALLLAARRKSRGR